MNPYVITRSIVLSFDLGRKQSVQGYYLTCLKACVDCVWCACVCVCVCLSNGVHRHVGVVLFFSEGTQIQSQQPCRGRGVRSKALALNIGVATIPILKVIAACKLFVIMPKTCSIDPYQR